MLLQMIACFCCSGSLFSSVSRIRRSLMSIQNIDLLCASFTPVVLPQWNPVHIPLYQERPAH